MSIILLFMLPIHGTPGLSTRWIAVPIALVAMFLFGHRFMKLRWTATKRIYEYYTELFDQAAPGEKK